jgi:hypothetical protein
MQQIASRNKDVGLLSAYSTFTQHRVSQVPPTVVRLRKKTRNLSTLGGFAGGQKCVRDFFCYSECMSGQSGFNALMVLGKNRS